VLSEIINLKLPRESSPFVNTKNDVQILCYNPTKTLVDKQIHEHSISLKTTFCYTHSELMKNELSNTSQAWKQE